MSHKHSVHTFIWHLLYKHCCWCIFCVNCRSLWWSWCLVWSTSSGSGRQVVAADTGDGRAASDSPGSPSVSLVCCMSFGCKFWMIPHWSDSNQMFYFFPFSRFYRVRGIIGSDRCRDAGQHLRHLGAAQHAFPADPAYGSYGQTRRHLETAGLSGLCSQQGRNRSLSSAVPTFICSATTGFRCLKWSCVWEHTEQTII